MEKGFYKQTTLPHAAVDLPASDVLPDFVGPYKIESLLSKGGMSLLYLARHPEKPFPIAIKVLSPQFVSHPEMKQQFLRESQIIALTNHPNIIALYGQGEWEGGLYIAMEFIQGISLRQFILQQTLSLRSILDTVLQVSYALLHLHTHGVIHRDLKPENILITEQGQVKVIDFGIAQLMSEEAISFGKGKMVGTPSYMSPEQKRDPLQVTPSTDIYALGVIAYELILGKLSFGSIDLALLPKGLQKIVKKMLSPSLDERYQDIVDVISDIGNYMKQDAFKKDREKSDEVRELLEKITHAHASILLSEPPKWNDLEIGIGKGKQINTLGLYYDAVRLTDGTFLILMAECPGGEIDSLPRVGILKGMTKSLIQSMRELGFSLALFIDKLNQVALSVDIRCTLSAIHCNLIEDSFTAISCGCSPLWHVPFAEGTIRSLENTNPLIGQEFSPSFTIINDVFREGDVLLFHTFSTEDVPSLSELMQKGVEEYSRLGVKQQSDSLFRYLTKQSRFQGENCPKAVIALQRII